MRPNGGANHGSEDAPTRHMRTDGGRPACCEGVDALANAQGDKRHLTAT